MKTCFAIIFVSLCITACTTSNKIEIEPLGLDVEPLAFGVTDTGQGETIKLVYLHGMASERSCYSYDAAVALMKAKGGKVRGACSTSKKIDLGITEPRLHYGSTDFAFVDRHGENGDVLWNDEVGIVGTAEPFYISYKLSSRNVTADVYELNYWPLLVFAKCKTLVRTEEKLNTSPRNTKKCKKLLKVPLFDSDEQSSGGAALNVLVKELLFEWGFADAVLTLGAIGDVNSQAVLNLLQIVRDEGDNSTPMAIMAASLGGYVLTDALVNKWIEEVPEADAAELMEMMTQLPFSTEGEDGETYQQRMEAMMQPVIEKVDGVIANTQIYFFANQISLLSLADISLAQTGIVDNDKREQRAAILTLFGERLDFKQIVAFNEYSDLLTYYLPDAFRKLEILTEGDTGPTTQTIPAINVNLQFAGQFLGIAANPITAHTGYWTNDRVIKTILEGAVYQGE